MTEMGIIYHGAYDDIAERDWNYGQVVQRQIEDFWTGFPDYLFCFKDILLSQFNYGVLDACLYIMDKCEMPITNRGDPIKVTRKASAMVRKYLWTSSKAHEMVYRHIRYAVKWCINTHRTLLYSKLYTVADTVNTVGY